MLSGYPSIFNLGHGAVVDLLKEAVIVEEKVDGSQLSFGLDEKGELQIRSKGSEIHPDYPHKMFQEGVAAIRAVASDLPKGFVFRGEYLQKPKHNVLAYTRIPKNHIIVFDVNAGPEIYLEPLQKRKLAAALGFETVPLLFHGIISGLDRFKTLLETESVLGGRKVEGVVIKPASYHLFGRDKKVLMAKFVSEQFKEVHRRTWKNEHGTPGSRDIIESLAAELATPARWQKSLIHLREEGKILDEPKDIGALIAAAQQDVLKECDSLIRERLFLWGWSQLRRRVTRNLASWYKQLLAEKQFAAKDAPSSESVPAETGIATAIEQPMV